MYSNAEDKRKDRSGLKELYTYALPMRIIHDTQMKDFEKPILSTSITHTQSTKKTKITPQVQDEIHATKAQVSLLVHETQLERNTDLFRRCETDAVFSEVIDRVVFSQEGITNDPDGSYVVSKTTFKEIKGVKVPRGGGISRP